MKSEGADIPYYQQLKKIFINHIKNGKLSYGDKIPSERELADIYQVSRMTARHAVMMLEREGFVERRVGAGTFITNERIRWNTVTVNSFTKGMQDKGRAPSTRTLIMEEREADAQTAEQLKVSEGERLFYLKRLRKVDNIPLAIEVSQIPYRYCPQIEHYMEDNVSLYHVLHQYFDIQLIRQKQYMKISLASQSESTLLGVPDLSPCISIEGQAFAESGQPIEVSQTLARGDLVEFYSEPSNP
ncbi:GntR family transcriptional regulator [Domibacillus indicus]|uniref:GntR family transcriptional regulator n=1 Tax=Domibacillus indicus TaxID=1437523 RepID=UPI0020418B86|nr:GntR family transcriptional regulator [Domibacillus indicus]MCM3789729.1 GntR family transcriptional regulator [Domibacillus indicus]